MSRLATVINKSNINKNYCLQRLKKKYRYIKEDRYNCIDEITKESKIEDYLTNYKGRCLFGVVFSVKSNIAVKNISLTFGLKKGEKSFYTDGFINSLQQKGAYFIGSNTMDGGGIEAKGESPLYGEIINPFDCNKNIYGSSSGSAAAVAANLVDFSVATDLGGSSRLPAMQSNTVALKFKEQRRDVNLRITRCESLSLITNDIQDMYFLIQAVSQEYKNKDKIFLQPVYLKDKDNELYINKCSAFLNYSFKIAYDSWKVISAIDIVNKIEGSNNLKRYFNQFKPYIALKKYAQELTLQDIKSALNNKKTLIESIYSKVNFDKEGLILLNPLSKKSFPINYYLVGANLCELSALSLNLPTGLNVEIWHPDSSKAVLLGKYILEKGLSDSLMQ